MFKVQTKVQGRTNPTFEGKKSPFAKQRELSLAIKQARAEERGRPVTSERFEEIARKQGKAAAGRLYLMDRPMSDDVPVAAASALMGDGSFDLPALNKLSVPMTGNELRLAEPGSKKAALFAPNERLWASELLYAYHVLRTAGYDVELFTPSGSPPKFLEPSTTEGFRDMPRNGIEVTPGEAKMAERAMTEGTPENDFLNSAKPISSLLRQEAHPQDSIGKDTGAMGATAAEHVADANQSFAERFQALWVAGGSGGFDLHLRNLEEIISGAAAFKIPIAVNCYGANPLMHAKTNDGRYLVEGHKMAVHTNTHDWKNEPYQAQPPFSLEDGVEARGAAVIARPMEHTISAQSTNVYGETILTAASTHDGLATAIQLVNLLQNGGARRGETKVVVNLGRERPVNSEDLKLGQK